MTATTFFDNFFPAFLATLAGVVLGIPAGVFVSTYTTRLSDRAQRHARDDRRHAALRVLRDAITANQGQLDTVRQLATSADMQITFHTGLEVAQWEMERDDIHQLVSDVEFRAKAAQYFERIATLRQLAADLNSFSVGVNAAMQTSAQVRSHIRTMISQLCAAVATEGDELLVWLAEHGER